LCSSLSLYREVFLSSSSRSVSADRARVVRTRRRHDLDRATLADADRRLLAVLCTHRVVRQDQLERLLPDVPQRTLRYRTRRLHDLGLMGRTRPYRERGSAPNHHWPTRRADCMMNGDPIPRGGEHEQPNPLFLAHAAALTELYVALAVEGPSAGLSLFDYRREGEAREPFKHLGKQRALAPDAMVILTDEQERKLGAFVELDLGTMSHTRLRQKADLYAAYTAADVWQDRHLFLPALLFLTTTDTRARRFLAALQSALAENRRKYSQHKLAAGAGALALQPSQLFGAACLVDFDGKELLTLRDVLEAARAPYEQIQRANQKRKETLDRKRAQLHEDPTVAREALRRFQGSHNPYLEELGPAAQRATEILIASTDIPLPREQAVLQALVTDLEDVLVQPGFLRPPPPSADTRRETILLANVYRERQQRMVEELAARYSEGPCLRHARETLRDGELLDRRKAERLPGAAKSDADARDEQHRLRLAYLEWRDVAARQMVRNSGPLGRLTRSREEFFPRLDRERLHVCDACREIVFPASDKNSTDQMPTPCHYCRKRERLMPYDQNKASRTGAQYE
jgi:Replication-relaxation